MVTVFFTNIKLDLLYNTVSNRSRRFSQNIPNSEKRFSTMVQINFQTGSEPIFDFKVFYYKLSDFFFNVKLARLQITVLKQSHNLIKTWILLKEIFYCCRANVFSKFLRKIFTI